jgi:hypothetical protein
MFCGQIGPFGYFIADIFSVLKLLIISWDTNATVK